MNTIRCDTEEFQRRRAISKSFYVSREWSDRGYENFIDFNQEVIVIHETK